MATGRVSVAEVQAVSEIQQRIQFRQVAEAVTPHLLSGSSFSSQEFRFRLSIVKMPAGAKRLSRPVVSWVFPV